MCLDEAVVRSASGRGVAERGEGLVKLLVRQVRYHAYCVWMWFVIVFENNVCG